MGWQCQSLCCKLLFARHLGPSREHCNLQNGIKQGEQRGSFLDIFGIFLETCFLNIDMDMDKYGWSSDESLHSVTYLAFFSVSSVKTFLWGDKKPPHDFRASLS